MINQTHGGCVRKYDLATFKLQYIQLQSSSWKAIGSAHRSRRHNSGVIEDHRCLWSLAQKWFFHCAPLRIREFLENVSFFKFSEQGGRVRWPNLLDRSSDTYFIHISGIPGSFDWSTPEIVVLNCTGSSTTPWEAHWWQAAPCALYCNIALQERAYRTDINMDVTYSN